MRVYQFSSIICLLGLFFHSITVWADTQRVDSLIAVYQSVDIGEYERDVFSALSNLIKEDAKEEAIAFKTWIEQRINKEDNLLGKALLLHLDAQQYFLSGDLSNAQLKAEESSVVWLELDDLISWASAQIIIGNVAFFRERPFDAIIKWQEAADIYEMAFDSMNTSKCYSNIGAAYLQLDYLQSAFASFERATNLIPVEQRNSEAYQVAKINSAVAAMELSLYPQAQLIFNELRSGTPASDYVTFLLDMNEMLNSMNLKDQEGFLRMMPAVLEGTNKYSQHVSDVQESLARGFLRFKDPEKARPFLEELKFIMQADSSYGTLTGLGLFVEYMQITGENMLDITLIRKLIDNLEYGVEAKEIISLYQLMALESAGSSDFKAAYLWQYKVDSLKDNLMDSVLYTQFHDFSEAYRYRVMIQEREKLTSDLAENERLLQESKFKNIYLTLFVGVTILFFVAIAYWKRRKSNLSRQIPSDKR